jgi:hypothetical protein
MAENTGNNLFADIVQDALAVITKPAEFYRGMAKKGGFGPPLVFMVVMGVVAGLVRAVMAMIGIGAGAGVGMGLAAVILVPVLLAVLGFVVAAVFFVLWKIMGSGEDYETAYRCMAYSCAITPLTTLIEPVPYLGSLVALAWGTWLIVCASTEVHGIGAKKAWTVFGVIAVLLALASISAQMAGRMMAKRMSGMEMNLEQMQKQMDSGEMTPEEAGRMVGQFMKGLEKAQQK